MSTPTLSELLSEIRACTLCRSVLPHEPRPVLQCHERARILIAGQAPGRKVHESGIPFDDASGERLRSWLGMSREQFYDPQITAIVPMGFCYPGSSRNGDLPPRPECAAQWRKTLLNALPGIRLTLLIGQYAQAWHRPGLALSVTERVRAWRESLPAAIPLPHPSPRNAIWQARNPWFEAEVLPALQTRVQEVLNGH